MEETPTPPIPRSVKLNTESDACLIALRRAIRVHGLLALPDEVRPVAERSENPTSLSEVCRFALRFLLQHVDADRLGVIDGIPAPDVAVES